jgi:molybdopterin-guanine dinucleotide biosynthesis adapter protein
VTIPPIVAVSGSSGVGKTRLLARLIPALVARGLRVGALKHTSHDHPFDRRGKDTEVLRRAGAIAAAIDGPRGLAYFGPPARSVRALARLLPPVDVIVAEGFKHEPLPRVEVHRRTVSREFLCASDRRVLAVVTDEPPPRPVPAFEADDVEALADLLCARLRLARGKPRPRERLRVRPTVSRLPAEGSERTDALGRQPRMAKTTNRKGRSSRSRAGRRSGSSRSEAGRKGGNATLRARGPEFYSEIGRKGGKKSGGARSRRAAMARRGGTSRRGTARGGSRRGTRSSRTRK